MPSLYNEPHRRLICYYAGFTCINSELGVKTMNKAIEIVLKNTNPHQWLTVNASISPSAVNLFYRKRIAVNLRICSIPFFGIYNKDKKICGIVQHTADDLFICHVIACQTNAIELCKTLRAACELRYQQCIDSKIYNKSKPSSDLLDDMRVNVNNQPDRQTEKKQIILVNIINQFEKMKYEVCKRIRQHSNWIKSCLWYSNDEPLLGTIKTHNNDGKTTDICYLF
ncbi:unnamed protein product [Heterobilharzia americana]|nr:unnamed protein product [Heterobilharzia americana]CAH8583830.1 unnamed protein product [Heterobilharzia americana]